MVWVWITNGRLWKASRNAKHMQQKRGLIYQMLCFPVGVLCWLFILPYMYPGKFLMKIIIHQWAAKMRMNTMMFWRNFHLMTQRLQRYSQQNLVHIILCVYWLPSVCHIWPWPAFAVTQHKLYEILLPCSH